MRRAVAALAASGVLLGLGLAPAAEAASGRLAAAPAKINGSGSSYVAVAMQQWVADAQLDGLQVNYLPTGSPQGLTSFSQSLIDFAGTEAEYSALGVGAEGNRGYQYVPDVAGAVAIMYNVVDQAGRKVDYLRMSRSTVAKIFMGYITRWNDPAITADNKGLVLPNEPIEVVYRGGQSGTTALFYDFVQNTEPSLFAQWAGRHRLPTQVRIIQLDGTPEFAPKTLALNGSDAIAQHVASSRGRWSVAYDEFAFAKTYGAAAARIQNESGDYVLPFAQNISAALESAKLRSDLSQDLRDVYRSPDPLAYPISAYSYIVTQCASAGDRPTCKGAYTNPGVAETLSKWLRYIACEGQVNMAEIGYSPLPKNLSQEMANSIARMTGGNPETLTAENCANPRFRGSLGAGATSPSDPLDKVQSLGPGGTGGGSTGGSAGGATGGGGGAGGAGGATGGSATGGSGGVGPGGAGGSAGGLGGAGVVGRSGGTAAAVGGGSEIWRAPAPAAYDRVGGGDGDSILPALLLLVLVVAPPIVLGRALGRRGGVPFPPADEQDVPA